jgi:hypothetical protein
MRRRDAGNYVDKHWTLFLKKTKIIHNKIKKYLIKRREIGGGV